MSLIRSGIFLGKTIKNARRLKEIVTVFAKHGFEEFIGNGITSKIPDFALPESRRKLKEELRNLEDKKRAQVVGERLRECFDELGPTFVKFGQLLASREDLFDPSFITEMKKLRDQVKPFSFSEAEKILNENYKRDYKEIFSSINATPIGMASIGVVYEGVLQSGEEVVIKIQRPHIRDKIENDLSILHFIVIQVEKISDEIKYLGLSRVIEDFAFTLENELNFHLEATNAIRLKSNLKKHDTEGLFYIPNVYKAHSSEVVLVLEKLKGIPFSQEEKLKSTAVDLDQKLHKGISIFLSTFLQDGFFHADLHGGNFFYLEDGRIGIIDFGLMGSLSNKARLNFMAIVYALNKGDYENLVYEFLDIAEFEDIPDTDQLIVAVKNALSPFVGLSVQETDFNSIMRAITDTMLKQRIFLPREWIVVFRALIALDGVGKSLSIDFNIYEILESDLEANIKNSLDKDKMVEELIWNSREMMTGMKMFPRHLKWFMKDFAKKKYAFEISHKNHEGAFEIVARSIQFFAFVIMGGVFVVSGVYCLDVRGIHSTGQIPPITWCFWTLAILSFTRGLLLSRKI